MRGDKSEEELNKYITIAWVNYNWYDENWNIIKKEDKQLRCYNEILSLIQTGKINNTDYAYLIQIQNYIIEHPELHGNINEIYKFLIKSVPHGYKVLFRIKY
jgi:hypothetical protein